ncbi:hypothetical protein SAMN06297251_11942 [Fulvimarina manganoxydans]|uniref:NfeD-like C-terminal domain-containing protein n=1 Tax=Fulvimarina manganoxydans TaxID=937218 RepID=A0A1W2E135_9HYPH|nr:NfeD family protein [Fulvimarina manganoxydans]SMD02758.1 hypothetical protein SAMN06297251_11942 [Fulvimarina manganoxydans]
MGDFFTPEILWWVAGFLLLGLELAVPGVYLLFFGIAALIVGTNAFFLGDSIFGVGQQLVAFVVVSAVVIFLGGRFYRAGRTGPPSEDDNPVNRLIGREAKLSEAIEAGRGRVALGDSWWTVEGPDLAKGTRVRIVGANGNVLRVEPIGAGTA